MIRYALKCSAGHAFESWFQSADAFQTLAARGMVACAICGDNEVTKALMAPPVSAAQAAPAPAPPPATAAPADTGRPLGQPAHPTEQALRALREHLGKTSTYVGGRFVQEARAMHLGEAEARPIHGEATPQDARALVDEGVPVAPLPILPPDKAN